MDKLILCLLIVVFGALIIWLIRLPIIIAEKRKLSENDIKIITLLAWVSLLVGVTWIIALIMALVYQPRHSIPAALSVDELEKMYELKEKGILTQEEYEKVKLKLIK